MDLNLENISKIDTSKSYYLSDSGEIKKSGLLHKFKCLFNLGHSRERVANLVNAIRRTLITESNEMGKEALDKQMKNISTKKALTGSEIKVLADNFITSNKKSILKHNASKMVSSLANQTIESLSFVSNGQIKFSDSLKKLLTSYVEKYVDNPPTTNKDGQTVIDEETLRNRVNNDLSLLGKLIIDIKNSEDLGKPEISDDYAEYLQSALSEVINGKIKPEDFSIENLKSPDVASEQKLQKFLNSKNSPDKSAVIEAVVKYTAEDLKGDPELQSIVRKVALPLILRADNTFRTVDAIKKKIECIKTNLEEFRALSVNNPKILDKGKALLIALRGASFPKGTIASQFNFINSAELGDLTKINGNSSAMDLHKAILKLKNVMIDASRVLLPDIHSILLRCSLLPFLKTLRECWTGILFLP